MNKIISISLIAIILFLTGCATIAKGTSEKVDIKSNPAEASIKIVDPGGNTVFQGKTPSVAMLPKKSEYDVFITLDGYKETKIHISKQFEPLFIGNLICGGIIGIIIDAASGAMNMLRPNQINVELVTASVDNKDEVYAVLNTVDENGEIRQIVLPMVKL